MIAAAALRVFAFVLVGAGVPVFAQTRIVLSLDAQGEPVVEYRPASGAQEIVFAERGREAAAVRRTSWNSDAQCARVEDDRIVFSAPRCARARVRLAWDGVVRDRVYPAVTRLENGGVLVFARELQVKDGASLASWEVRAPQGGVASFRGRKSSATLDITPGEFADDLRGWIYLGPDRFFEASGALMLVDEGVAPALLETLERAVKPLLELYGALLGGALPQTPSVFVLWSDRGAPESAVQADTVPGGTMRIGLRGKNWGEPTASMNASFRAMLAHELAHFWNSGFYRERAPGTPWLTEGNSELLRAAALLRLNVETPTQAARRINTALNQCFVASAGRPWRALAGRDAGDLPYTCGFAIQLVALALAQRHDASIDAFAFWRGLWQRHPRYDESALIEHMRHLGAWAAAQFLERALGEEGGPLDRELVNGIEAALGIELPRAPRQVHASQALNNLMRHDCGGNAGFWTNDDHLFTDAVAGCRFFKAGWKVRYLAGRDLLRDPVEAVREAKAACARDQALVLRTLDDREFSMPCDDAVAALLPAELRVANLQPLRVARILIRQ